MSITLRDYCSECSREERRCFKKMLKELYISAFPDDERAPFFMLMSRAKKNRAEMLIAENDGRFAGLAYMVCDDKVAYLFYLAVDDEMRGKGIGSAIVKGIAERYKGRRIFLAREQLDESAENYAQRVSRRNFYLRCGFEDLPCMIKEASVVYDVMGIGGNVTAEEYHGLMESWAGRLMMRFIDMKIIEKEQK